MKTTGHIAARTLALKRGIGSCFWLIVLASALLVMLASRVAAQTFTTLHSFTAMGGDAGINYYCPSTNSDGAVPNGPLVLYSNTLYGTTQLGSSGAGGTVFAVNTDGSGFTTLLNFTVETSDGYLPYDGLVLSSGTLYGTTGHSGNGTAGVVFSINTDGSGFTPLYGLPDGDHPQACLIQSSGTLYGTLGGLCCGADNGSVFAINADGTGYQTLHSFTLGTSPIPRGTNSDGAYPQTQLVLSGGTLYGITENGGGFGKGTVFAVNIDGTGFRVLHTFTGGSDGGDDYSTGNPIGNPRLVLSGNTLYGTAEGFGSFGSGTVFALNTDGTGFKVLYSGSDGYTPSALVTSGNTLYVAARYGGSYYNGSVFKIDTDGTGFTVLHNFKATVGVGSSCVPGHPMTNSDGIFPNSLISSGDTLYGTTSAGGGSGWGTVFSLSLLPVTPPQLAITLAAGNVILTWSTNSSEYFLQSSTNLSSAADWTAVSPRVVIVNGQVTVTNFPVVVNGQNTVTNPVSGTQQFYRLMQ